MLALSIEHRSAVELPAPTGPFAVGRAIEEWKTVHVWIWYPAASRSGATAAYLPPQTLAAIRRPLIFRWLTHDLAKVRVHALRDAAIAPGPFPVVLLRAGGSLEVWNYTTLAEDLASHGYVVVGVDAIQPRNGELCLEKQGDERRRCIDRILDAWLADLSFVADRLPTSDVAPHIDMARIGAFGHSFGGAQVLRFCRDDARCKAVIDVDGEPLGAGAVRKPLLFLLSDHSGESDAPRVMADVRASGGEIVTIAGANHFTFTDDGALLKSRVFRGLLRLFGKLKIDTRRQLAVTAEAIHTFFDRHLKRL